MNKPGYQTSEFWLTIFANAAAIGGVAGGVIPGWGLAIAGATNVAYIIARSVVKARSTNPNPTNP